MESSDSLFLVFCNLLLGVIFATAFVANVLVLIVFYRKSGLRSIANRFVVNLMIINLVSCLSLLPLLIAENSIPDGFLCVATELSSVFCSAVVVYAVLLIALDQYCAVVDPLHYHRVISSAKSFWLIVSSWCFSAGFALATGVQPSFDGVGYSVFRQCKLDAYQQSGQGTKTYRYIFCAVYTLSVFVAPFLLICFIYYKICAAASGNTKRTRSSCVSTDESFCSGTTDPHRRDQLETSELLSEERPEHPSFVVTSPSPPRTPPEDDPKTFTPFLKPTLKNNSSFSRLSSLHIQFTDESLHSSERRHSNTTSPVEEFVIIPKSRSPSIQSAFDSQHPRSSRSSSINSSRHPPSRASSIRSTSSCIVHSIRHRISNASLFRYREEARAARISALVIVMALICWLPFFTVFYLHSSASGYFPVYLDSFAVAFLLLSSVFSPFLFAFRNRKIKKELRKLLYFRRSDLDSDKSFYRYNFSADLKSTQLFFGLAKKPIEY